MMIKRLSIIYSIKVLINLGATDTGGIRELLNSRLGPSTECSPVRETWVVVIVRIPQLIVRELGAGAHDGLPLILTRVNTHVQTHLLTSGQHCSQEGQIVSTLAPQLSCLNIDPCHTKVLSTGTSSSNSRLDLRSCTGNTLGKVREHINVNILETSCLCTCNVSGDVWIGLTTGQPCLDNGKSVSLLMETGPTGLRDFSLVDTEIQTKCGLSTRWSLKQQESGQQEEARTECNEECSGHFAECSSDLVCEMK